MTSRQAGFALTAVLASSRRLRGYGRPFGLLLALVTLTHPASLVAQSVVDSRVAGAKVLDSELVVVDGRNLGHVVGLPSYPAARRAREIAERIEAFAEDPALDPGDLRVEETEASSAIVGPSGVLFRILDLDAQFEGVGVERSLVAKVVLTRVREVIEGYREDRRPGVLLVNAAYALGLSLIHI